MTHAVVPEPDSRARPAFNVGVHGLRGVAASMVLFAHILGGTSEHVYTDNTDFAASVLPMWNFGTYFVYLFFAISGFVILPTAFDSPLRVFALRRFIRIYPLFLACTLLYLAGYVALHTQPPLSAATVFYALTFTNLLAGTEQLTPNAWSLSYEVVFYVLAAVAALSIRYRAPVAGLIGGVAALAFLISFPAAIYFVIGAAVYYLHRRGAIRRLRWRAAAEVFLAGALAVVVSRGHFAYNHREIGLPLAQLAIATTAGYFLFAVEPDSLTSRVLASRPFQYLGTISYSVYLVHPYVYLAMRRLFVRAHLFTENVWLSLVIFIVAVFAATIATTHLSYHVFERWPQGLALRARARAKWRPVVQEFAPTPAVVTVEESK